MAATAAFLLLAVGSATSADTFELRLVSQTTSTITLGWDPQPGYGYLFSANGSVVSRTNDATRSSVKFSKVANGSYEVAVIVKGSTGTYPPPAPPPPPPPAAACADGVDNDGDGKIDYPADPGCSSATDTDETDPAPLAQCANGLDDDGDGKIDLADPGCSSSSDTDETDPVQPPPTGYPDASNTGVPTGTTLTAYTGPSNITAANTVITGKTMGCVSVSAPGVIIRNSRITCGSGYAVYVDDRVSTATLLTIEDSEISCSNAPGSAGIGEADITARRVEITHCENGLDMNQNIDLEDSYVHDLYNGGESHADGAQVALGHWNGSGWVCCGLNITLKHNTIFGMGDGDTTFGTSAIITTSTDVNVLIENNLLGGGAYTLYCNRPGKGTNFRVLNNKFTQRFKSTVGFYGPWTDCQDEDQSENVYYESGLPLN